MTASIRGPLVGCVLFALYALTASRSVGWEDSAFLQLCLATLGVPHGPGFPLYVLVGKVFVMPFGRAAAWGANLFSGLAMAAAGAVLLEIVLTLARPHGRGEHVGNNSWAVVAAMGVIVAWGTLDVIWQQAVRSEVYALALLCVLLTALYSLKSSRSRRAGAWNTRFAVASVFMWGCAMAVHPLIALAAATPWAVRELWLLRTQPRRLAIALGCGLLPLSAYLYPFVRGRMAGAWAWGDFGTWASTFDYYLRRSAWSMVRTEDGGLRENLSGWLFSMPHFFPTALWLAVATALVWIRRQWPVILSMAGTAALVLWAAPFDLHNLDLIGYFLPLLTLAAGLVGVFVVRTVLFLRAQMIGLESRSRLALGTFTIALMLGWPTATLLFRPETPSRLAGAHELLTSLALAVPRGAVLLATEDNLLGALEYVQRVEGVRRDITVIAPGALRYPFYRRGLPDSLPGNIPGTWRSPDVWPPETWEQEVRAWLARIPADVELCTPLDATPGVDAMRLVPAGFLYVRSSANASILWDRAAEFWNTVPAMSARDPIGRDIMARWTFNFGAYAIARGRDDIGWGALLAAVRLTPEDPEMYFLLGRALATAGRAEDAQAMLAAAVELAPFRERYQRELQSHNQTWAVSP